MPASLGMTRNNRRVSFRPARSAPTLLVPALSLAALLAATPAAAEVPIAWSESGHPTIPATVDGKGPFPFVIGTSAEGTALFNAFAAEQGLLPTDPGAEGSEDQPADAGTVRTARVGAVEVDGRTAHNVEAIVLPDQPGAGPLSGVVGLDVIGRYAVEFDMRGGQVALHPPGTLPARLGNDRMKPIQAVRLRGGLLGLPVTINGVEGIALLDTGARESRINARFARAAGLAGAPGPDGEGAAAAPATGTVEFGNVRKMLGARVADLPVFRAFGIADRPAMLLGMDLLRDVHMLVDFPWQTVWMDGPAEAGPVEPRAADAEPAATLPVETLPDDTAPAEAAPPEKTAVEEAPPEDAPADAAPAAAAPVEEAPAEPAPEAAAPDDPAPAEADPLAGIEAGILEAAEAEAEASAEGE